MHATRPPIVGMQVAPRSLMRTHLLHPIGAIRPVLAAVTLAVLASCTSSSHDEGLVKDSAALSGRYGPFPDASSVWFSGDEGRAYTLASVDAQGGQQVEEGTYTYEGDSLRLVSTGGTIRSYRARISERLSAVAQRRGTRVASVRPRNEATGSATSPSDEDAMLACKAFEPTMETPTAPGDDLSLPTGETTEGGGTPLLDACGSVTLLAGLLDIAAKIDIAPVNDEAAPDDSFNSKALLVADRKGGGKPSATTKQAMGNSQNVHIRFAAFIPCEVVGPGSSAALSDRLVNLYFGGDNREFDFNLGMARSRAAVSALVSMTRIETQTSHMGISYQYRAGDLTPVGNAWSPFARCFSKKSGITPEYTHTDSSPILQAWHATQTNNGDRVETKTHIQIHATGQASFGELPASLDGEADLYVTWQRATSRALDYRLETTHDGFPAYEIYVNGRSVHTHDPRTTGRSPLDLSPTPGGRISDSKRGNF